MNWWVSECTNKCRNGLNSRTFFLAHIKVPFIKWVIFIVTLLKTSKIWHYYRWEDSAWCCKAISMFLSMPSSFPEKKKFSLLGCLPPWRLPPTFYLSKPFSSSEHTSEPSLPQAYLLLTHFQYICYIVLVLRQISWILGL